MSGTIKPPKKPPTPEETAAFISEQREFNKDLVDSLEQFKETVAAQVDRAFSSVAQPNPELQVTADGKKPDALTRFFGNFTLKDVLGVVNTLGKMIGEGGKDDVAFKWYQKEREAHYKLGYFEALRKMKDMDLTGLGVEELK